MQTLDIRLFCQPEVPSCLKVLRLRPERRFCRLGDLSKEASRSHASMDMSYGCWRKVLQTKQFSRTFMRVGAFVLRQVGWKHGALIQRLESQRKAGSESGRSSVCKAVAQSSRQGSIAHLEVKSDAFYKKKTASLRAKNEAGRTAVSIDVLQAKKAVKLSADDQKVLEAAGYA